MISVAAFNKPGHGASLASALWPAIFLCRTNRKAPGKIENSTYFAGELSDGRVRYHDLLVSLSPG